MATRPHKQRRNSTAIAPDIALNPEQLFVRAVTLALYLRDLAIPTVQLAGDVLRHASDIADGIRRDSRRLSHRLDLSRSTPKAKKRGSRAR